MAISIRATGTYTNARANITPAIPAGAVAGDMMLCCVVNKEYNSVPTMPAGWTLVGFATDGTVASDTDTGSIRSQIFYKEHTGSETNPTVTNGNGEETSGVILVFQKASNLFWSFPVGAGGGDNTANTTFSITAATNFGVTAGDMLIVTAGLRSDNVTLSSKLLAATGATMGTFVAAPTTDHNATARDHLKHTTGYRPATAGTNTSNPLFQATLSASHTGSGFFVRLREQADSPLASFDPMGTLGFFGL